MLFWLISFILHPVTYFQARARYRRYCKEMGIPPDPLWFSRVRKGRTVRKMRGPGESPEPDDG